MRKHFYVALVCLVLTLLLGGCDGDDAEQNMIVAPPPTPGPPATSIDFQSFVRQLLASTSENTDPTPVNASSFTNLLADGDPQPLSFFQP